MFCFGISIQKLTAEQRTRNLQKRINQGDQNNRFTHCRGTIFSLPNPRAKYDSKIDKKTAIEYFHRARAYDRIVPHKSYAQAVKSIPSTSKYVKQVSRDIGQYRPLGSVRVNKLHVTKPDSHNVARNEKSNGSRAVSTNVAGAGIKSCVSERKIPITLHNRFQMFDSFNDMHKAFNKVSDQGVLTETDGDNVHDTGSVLQNTVKIPGKRLGVKEIPT